MSRPVHLRQCSFAYEEARECPKRRAHECEGWREATIHAGHHMEWTGAVHGHRRGHSEGPENCASGEEGGYVRDECFQNERGASAVSGKFMTSN